MSGFVIRDPPGMGSSVLTPRDR